VRSGYLRKGYYRFQKKWHAWLYWFAEKIAYRFADQGAVSSEKDKVYLHKKYGIKHEKISIITNFVNTKSFFPAVNFPEEKKILYVGRLNQHKNLRNLIEAISHTDFCLDIYGEGDQLSNLEAWSRVCQANVSFQGPVPNEKLPEIYRSYPIFILPSLYEGVPKVLLEAMACGLVCVGTNVDGISDIIQDGKKSCLNSLD